MKSKFMKWASAELFFITSVASSLMFGLFNANVARNMHLSQTTLGWLSGIFFIVYAIAQFYSGRLFVLYPARRILFVSSIVAAIGTLLFANTTHLVLLFVSRAMLGAGLATTFIGVLFIVQQNFTKQQFPFLSSLSQSIANFTAGMLGLILGSLHTFIANYHAPFNFLALALFICSVFILLFVDNNTTITDDSKSNSGLLDGISTIMKNPQVWYATIFFSGLFGGVLTFPDLFNISFQIDVFHQTFEHATMINAMILLGLTLGGLVAGYWSQRSSYITPSRVLSLIAIISFCVLMFVRFERQDAFYWVAAMGFLYGFGCSSSILAFQCVQLNVINVNDRALATSFVLTVSYIFSGMIEQPIVGRFIANTKITNEESYFLNHNTLTFLFSDHDKWYQYNAGLSFILAFITISFIASLFFKNPG